MEMKVFIFSSEKWELVPDSIREIKTLSIFKNEIKPWTTDKCPCRLCKNYIGQVGFI